MSSFSASAAEQALVSQIFQHADAQDGILRGAVAVRIFGGAKLQPAVLREIWNIADDENNGWLSRKRAAVAVRLMGWAQQGEPITTALVSRSGPLPTIEGITAVATNGTGVSRAKSPGPVGTGLPPFTAEDRTKFYNMFVKAGATNGLLSAEQARDIFVKSKLPNDTLVQVWNLADTKDRGTLDSTDFAIGMYFIQAVMTNKIATIPNTLPPGFYQQAAGLSSGGPASSIRSHSTGTTGSFSPTQSTFTPMAPQYTGQLLQPTHTGSGFPMSRPPPHLPARPNPSQIGSGAFGNAPQPKWDVTTAEKANSDGFFDTLDAQRVGYIEGDVAVPFMLESKLPGEVLAQVWDLADISGDGRLTRDGFAVAMHLIQKKLAGHDLPGTLPLSLVPPSLRGTFANGASPFSPPGAPVQQQQQEPPKDLFSWDDTTPPQSAARTGPFDLAPLQQPQQSGPPAPSIFSQSSPPPIPARAAPAAAPVVQRDPFGAVPFIASSTSKDLLDDDDAAISAQLHDKSAEIGNAQNQLNSTKRSLETVTNERSDIEKTLADQASQLSALQTQLASAKASYETETKLLATLRERYAAQNIEIQQAREQLIRAESDLSAVRVEKSEVEGAFMRDKEDARELHRKMIEASQQVDATKLEVEKAKKDAKQQKGLLAIAKKQLSTKEADRAKAEKERLEATAEADAVAKEKEAVEAEIQKITSSPPPSVPERSLSGDSLSFAAAHVLPATPDPASPSVSVKSNNPFDRLTGTTNTPRPQSPLVAFTGPTPALEGLTSSEPVNGLPDNDPFGFSQDEQSNITLSELPSDTPNGVTPRPELTPLPPSSATLEVLSPSSDSDFFATPLNSATFSPSQIPEKQNTLDAVIAKFPDLDDSASTGAAAAATPPRKQTLPGHFSEDETDDAVPHTDLGAQLKEIEVEESDSDSDDDDQPLAQVAQNLAPAASKPPVETNGTAQAITTQDTSNFDDIFGSSSPAPAALPTDALGASNPSDSAAPVVAGVNAFDEAMGKIASPPGTGAQQFSFDSAFEDTFDFSATEPAFPAAPKANGHSPAPAAVADDDGFGSLFTTAQTNGTSPAIPPIQATSPLTTPPPAGLPGTSLSQTTSGPSFDEAFSGFDSGPSLALDGAPSAPATPKPVVVAPESPKVFPTTSPARPSSPSPRARSPPPRSGSPLATKGRVSSSSSKEGRDKPKDPPPRHSKLSIRLPFGKKKKQEAAPPPPSLPPPAEERTPGDDDVEGVKQLTAMGFSREQAVLALETHGYDIPQALNSLLGAQ